ncbi:MAG: PorT family protein [Acidobacteria bacterium]|nr:PorT family protein [Acidobacteriota bacterium]
MHCRSWFLPAAFAGLTLLGAAPSASAQNLGVLAGLSSANVEFEAHGLTIGADAKTGFIGGLTLDYPVAGLFAIEVDGLLSMKGTKFDFGRGEAGSLTLTYLDMPVLGRLTVPAGATRRLYLMAGPSFDVKLHESSDPESSDEGSTIRAGEAAVTFGGGVIVHRFRVDARYALGLTSIVDESAEGFTAKNRVLSILVGVELR